MNKLVFKTLLPFVFSVAVCLFAGCGSTAGDGHASDTTPGGQPSTIEAGDPEVMQDMENIGGDPGGNSSGPITPGSN